jgi:acyl-CoA thioesterase FadM
MFTITFKMQVIRYIHFLFASNHYAAKSSHSTQLSDRGTHVNLWFRLIWLFVIGRSRAKLGLLDACVTPFRVWPSDLDALRHMNNGKYFSIMDLARIDLLQRSGVAARFRHAKLFPIVTKSCMRYRRSLTLWQPFTIETAFVAANETEFFVSQRFMRNSKCVAYGMNQGRMMHAKRGSIATAETLEIAGSPVITLPLGMGAQVSFESVWAQLELDKKSGGQ